MAIEQAALEDFKQIIFEEQGLVLTDEEAYQDAVAFLEAFKILVNGNSLIQKQSIDSQRKEHGNVSEPIRESA